MTVQIETIKRWVSQPPKESSSEKIITSFQKPPK